MNPDANQQERRKSDLSYTDLLNITTMTLATSDLDGNPHAAPVYFVADGIGQRLKIYFFSDRKSQHVQHLTQNPKAAAAIYPECRGWQDIRGLQMRGKACQVKTQAESYSAREMYKQKFPFVRSLETQVAQNQLYVYVPSWIRLVDNAEGFGYKKEWIVE